MRASVADEVEALLTGPRPLPIVTAGHPVLRRPAHDYDGELSADLLTELLGAMRVTMHAAPGVGLAAPQIGLSLRLAVLEDVMSVSVDLAVARNRRPLPFRVLINPSYTPVGTERAAFYEGCLSVPGYQAVVDRAASVHLIGCDENGGALDEIVTGWAARIVAHETDHLAGRLYLDAAELRSLSATAQYQQRWAGPGIEAARAELDFLTGPRVGVVMLPQFPAREAAPRWRSLQDRGFAHGWTYDHLAWRSLADEPWFATVPTLALAALSTTTMSVGTWVASPNFRHPVTFAKDLLTLDDLSGARIIAAIGAGGSGWDASVLGQPELSPGQRADRLIEFVTLTDLLLRQRETSWQGEFFVADRARMVPAGSRDRISLVVAGNGTRTAGFAADYDGWATTGAGGVDEPQWWANLAGLVARFAAACGQRSPAPRRYLSLDARPDYDFASLDCFLDGAGRAAELGFTDVVIHWPRPDGAYAGDESVLDRIGERLVEGRLRT